MSKTRGSGNDSWQKMLEEVGVEDENLEEFGHALGSLYMERMKAGSVHPLGDQIHQFDYRAELASRVRREVRNSENIDDLVQRIGNVEESSLRYLEDLPVVGGIAAEVADRRESRRRDYLSEVIEEAGTIYNQ